MPDAPAIWAITPNGIRLGKRLLKGFPDAVLYLPEKEGDSEALSGKVRAFSNLKDEISCKFLQHPSHVFIFSTGIAVRMIAPLLASKLSDPAVVVLDELGYHAISLISGHLGGANRLAREIAGTVNAVPVITTATDINGLPSMDMVAQAAGVFIETPGAIKTANMKLLKGEQLNVHDPSGFVLPLIPDASVTTDPDRPFDVACDWKDTTVPRGTLVFRPRILFVGIGCNRNTSLQDIHTFLCRVFRGHDLSLNAIAGLATTEVKADEQGILALGGKLGRPIRFYSKDELNSVETIENPSKMAEKHIGVKSVCEAAAILSALKGRLIVPKQKTRDVTLAVAVPE